QRLPVEVQRLGADVVKVLLVGINRQHTGRIRGFFEAFARPIFARQLYRCFQQVVLDGLERAMRQGKSRFVGIARAVLGQVVGKVDYAHAQGAALLGGIERRLYGVILV